MIFLSVLLAATAFNLCQCRRLDDIENDISVAPSGDRYGVRDNNPDVWIKMSAPPKPEIRKMVGAHVELECEAMGSPPPTLQWFKGDMALSERDTFENNVISEVPSQALGKIKGRLVINHLRGVHSGIYTCFAESGVEVARANTRITVLEPNGYRSNITKFTKMGAPHHVPRISLWAPTYMDVIGTNVVLPCRTFGNPKPSQVWLDPMGQIIGVGEGRVSVLPDGALSIKELNWGDMGVYTCVVRNNVGQDSVETFIYPMKESK